MTYFKNPILGCIALPVLFVAIHLLSTASYFVSSDYDCIRVAFPSRPADFYGEDGSDGLILFIPLVFLGQAVIAATPLLLWPFLLRISATHHGRPLGNQWKIKVIQAVHFFTCVVEIYFMSYFVYADGRLTISWGAEYSFKEQFDAASVPDMFQEELLLGIRAPSFVYYYACEYELHTFHNYVFIGVYWMLVLVAVLRATQLIFESWAGHGLSKQFGQPLYESGRPRTIKAIRTTFVCPVKDCPSRVLYNHVSKDLLSFWQHFITLHTFANDQRDIMIPAKKLVESFSAFKQDIQDFQEDAGLMDYVNERSEWRDNAAFARAEFFNSNLGKAAELLFNRTNAPGELRATPKTCYTYLLLDSTRFTRRSGRTNETLWSFFEFAAAVIYIGKASGGRPFDHLKETVKAIESGYPLSYKQEYLKNLSDYDDKKAGVYIVDSSDRYSYAGEAYARESTLMSLYPKGFLTNKQGGHDCAEVYKGFQKSGGGIDYYQTTPVDQMIREIGIYDLWTKYKCFLKNHNADFKNTFYAYNIHNVALLRFD